MSFSVLVLHGPNLSLLAREEIDPRLETRASELGVELRVVQSNGEQGLLDALHQHAEEVDAILVNPGALAPLAFSLAEGLQMTELPFVEVLLKALLPERGPSSLTGLAKQQLHGLGVDGYLRGLEALAPAAPARGLGAEESEEDVHLGKTQWHPVPSLPRKSIGRKPAAPSAAEAPARQGKTIGRVAPPERTTVAPAWKVPVTRGQVSERIKRRLKAEETPEELAQWAREQWTAIQRGDPCEPGAKETIENVLLTLMAGAKASDQVLVAQMAKLDR